ncbi:single-stranded-DNA-specific exonuclease RecJ [Luteimonas huabeiensis]|uniref:single-stranded-DNA-specific exonuclease RecJ n=1 Tax=Luteimonas huabeiensis TaxID=1244513 RepID=UPI000464A313|nr:single-stranded-DNA-specific exonuclease RecJ [Luteimonas huabeiensis]
MSPRRKIRRRPAGDTGHWPADVLPLLRRVYAARGVRDPAQARPRLAQLPPPDTLTGIADAARLLADAIAGGGRILVVGDFDCDGATACAVAVRGLRMLGARDVVHAVPNRIAHGYGLSPALVDELAALGPQLLVTVDHGIACHEGVRAAKARGWQVLVTDHHLPGPTLPPADAIVDPNLPGDAFSGKSLAGVGVIFYVLLALRGVLRARGAFDGREVPDLRTLLDLVAVGTVADLVALDAGNRALVGAGLQRLRAGQGCAGLRALIEVCGRDAARLTATDIAYAIGPRLNAAGRLEDMAIGIECLLCDEPARALELARLLDRINAERRDVQQTMVDAAEAALAARPLAFSGEAPAAVCLFDPDWHPGVVGLVASKLKERLHRPVVAFAPAEPGAGLLRGSARSIPGYHVRDALAAVHAAQPGLIERFGGHAMAAGLTLHRDAFGAFEAAFCGQAERALGPDLLQAVIDSDGALEPHEFDRRHAEALRDGGPWGQGFPEPVFDGEFALLDARQVGQRHLRMRLRVDGRREPVDAIHFGGWAGRAPPGRVRLAYRLAPDDYRGGDAVQLVVDYREDAAP